MKRNIDIKLNVNYLYINEKYLNSPRTPRFGGGFGGNLRLGFRERGARQKELLETVQKLFYDWRSTKLYGLQHSITKPSDATRPPKKNFKKLHPGSETVC